MSGWQPTHEEAGKICYVKNVRGWVGKLQLMAEPEMTIKVYFDAWEWNWTTTLFSFSFPVICCTICNLIDASNMKNRIEDEECNIPAEEEETTWTFKKLAGMCVSIALTWFDLYTDI